MNTIVKFSCMFTIKQENLNECINYLELESIPYQNYEAPYDEEVGSLIYFFDVISISEKIDQIKIQLWIVWFLKSPKPKGYKILELIPGKQWILM
jgi:hypothetical protein